MKTAETVIDGVRIGLRMQERGQHIDLAKFQDFGQTAEWAENPDMLYKYYHEMINEKGDIDEFWELILS